MPDYYFEHKRQQAEAIDTSLNIFLEIQAEYSKISNRSYSDFFEAYRLDDAEYALVALGSTAGTAKAVVDQLREDGEKVGLLKLRLFRPFPRRFIARALHELNAVGILDRSISFGSFGPLYLEVAAALSNCKKTPRLNNFIYGLGGRDIRFSQIADIFKSLQDRSLCGDLRYVGVRDTL